MPHNYDDLLMEYHGLNEEGFPQHEEWEHAAHYEHEEKFLLLRNICVTAAALLFVVSLLPESIIGHAGYLLKAIAYFCGALAYGAEIMVLTDGLHRKEPLKEMYMPKVFSVLYIVLGLSYLLH